MRRGTSWRVLATVGVVGLALLALATLPINLGLDLQGGVHVVLQAKPTDKEPVTKDTMQRAKAVISERVNGLGVAEPLIQLKGSDQIIVDLPGIRDQKHAIDVIGQTAQMEFRDPEGKVLFKGDQLADAWLSQDEYGKPAVSFKLKSEGARLFGEMTARNIGRQAPIYLDKKEISNPVIHSAITGGEGQISGNFTAQEAKELVTLLRAGSLPVPLEVVENRSVGPSLGRDSVDKGIMAGLISIAAIFLYMVFYYRLAGFIADVALILYGVIVMGVLTGLHATLTLPGIAGLILSVGMAVDANILIFERLKEELFAGKRLRAAIDAGFGRALSSIVDSNLTTIIAAVVLFYLGTGSIKGFAVTLTVGILVSMFTAITVTKLMLNALVDKDPDRYVRFFGVKEARQ